jgi:hypothetical protein
MGSITKAFFVAQCHLDYDREVSPGDLLVAIFRGDGHRIWYESHCLSEKIKPLGKISRIVPSGPEDKNQLLDAFITFAPDYFDSCPSMRTVREKVQGASFLDFELGENIPTEWEQLRSEARELLKKEIGVNEKVTRLFSTTLKQVCF